MNLTLLRGRYLSKSSQVMRRKFTLVDILFAVIVIFSAVVASPYVIRQFMGLSKPYDVVWNISLDLVIAAAFILVIYIIDKVLNRFL